MRFKEVFKQANIIFFSLLIVALIYVSAFILLSSLDSGENCELVVEQGVSCYKGCQYYAKISQNWSFYEVCVGYCDSNYFVTYDINNDIQDCIYGD